MKELIIQHISDAEQLEKLYRADKKLFQQAFEEIYPELNTMPIAQAWKARFDVEEESNKSASFTKNDILLLILAMLVPAILIRIPNIFDFDWEGSFFYERNAGLIVFFGLSFYLFLQKGLKSGRFVLFTIFVFIISTVYINLLPSVKNSDTINLAYIHLPLMIWCLYGLVYIGFNLKDRNKRIDYIKYNGDMAIFLAIIAIAGGILTGITIGLFDAIEMDIEDFYFDYIFVTGMVAAPVVATFIIQKFPQLTNKIAPIIANIFSPLVLITLLVYLASIIISGKDPYNDREFLLIFNLMLIGVMAIIVFTVTGLSHDNRNWYIKISLLILALVTLIIDLVALSAIIYRLGEYGFTPNRIAVLGSNLLILGNLLLIIIDLIKVLGKKEGLSRVENTIAAYLPIYTIWTIFMVFVVPWIFKLK
jgi:hypothetical protein